eukprot:2342381-Heterocapsa_arctica.AAC.1
MVLESCSWTLGPDSRALSLRNRKLTDPMSLRTETPKEADMNEALVKYVSTNIDTFYMEGCA